jgi:uncharacterized protein (DUF2236 family)
VLIYDRYVRHLSDDERAAYYEEMKPVAEAYGIPRRRLPGDWGAFRDYFEGMFERGLRVTPVTRHVADSVLNPELPLPVRLPARPAVEALRLLTVGSLPESIRGQLELDWSPLRDRLLAASQSSIRGLLRFSPAPLRQFPAARRAA